MAGECKELGIRAAMGASRAMLVGMVMREEMRTVVAGLAIGLAGAIPASRLLQSHLFQVRATDARAYMAAVLVLAATALLATMIPARRAAAANVSDVLRQE